ncbi:hypothetical protein ACRTDU_03960 [Sunxiuqinia elliptica]
MSETVKVVKQQFAARLRDDDQQIINEALPEIFPDHELSELTGREILRGSVENAVRTINKLKTSLPADLEKIKVLEQQVKDLMEENEKLLDVQLEKIKLEEQVQELSDEVQNLRIQASENGEKAANLEKYKPVDNEMRIIVEPFTMKALVAYARKVSLKSGKEVQPGKVLTSLFNYYITTREVEFDGFPFLLTNADLRNIKESLKKPANNEPTR